MEKINQQNELYKARVEVRQESGYLYIDKKQYVFLYTFLKKNKKLIFLATGFLALQVFLEILFFSLSHTVLNATTKPFYQRFSTVFLAGVIVAILFYVASVYLSIYYERKFVLGLTNRVRAKMFSNLLNKEESKVSTRDRLGIITKISYHLSLFTLGLDNAGVSFVRWFFYFSAIVIYIIVFDFSYLPYLLAVLFGSVLLYFISYKIANKYISKEAASYSRVVEHIVHSFYNFPLVKKLGLEKQAESTLEGVVKVDTYFRIRRDIWIRFSSKVIVIILIVALAIYSILKNFYSINIHLTSNVLLQGVVFVYIIRLFYLIVRVGLYTIPFKIGVCLCVPKDNFSLPLPRQNWDWQQLTFLSNKVKLFPESNYFKDFRVSFTKGSRYLFYSPLSFAGKTSLAQLFSGHSTFSRHSFLVKIEEERMAYNQWAELFSSRYLFSIYTSAYSTVGEFLFKKISREITNDDIMQLNSIITEHDVFSNFSLANNFLTNPIEDYATNYITLFKLHVLFCLLHKPDLIVVDNLWLDLNYQEINDMLILLDQLLKESTVAVFSRQINQKLKYNKIYEIKSSSIQEVAI